MRHLWSEVGMNAIVVMVILFMVIGLGIIIMVGIAGHDSDY